MQYVMFPHYCFRPTLHNVMLTFTNICFGMQVRHACDILAVSQLVHVKVLIACC